MRRALHMAAGVLVWAAHFTVIYGFTGLACARALDRAVPWVVGLATVAAAGVLAVFLVRTFHRRAAFEEAMAAGLAGLALLAVVWEGVSIVAVAPCVAR